MLDYEISYLSYKPNIFLYSEITPLQRGYSPVRCRQSSLDTFKRTKLNGSSEGCDLWEQPKNPPVASRRDEIRLVFHGMK